MPTEQELAEWYRQQQPNYKSLAEIAATTLTALLRSRHVDFLAISQRTKALESVVEKVTRKDYSDLSAMTDIAGIRVITYIESDIARVSELIEEAFLVDKDKSIDKSEELSDDRIGYRSVHFVCELGDARIALPELAAFRGLKFEIQIRTVLQHAWAEIEHDRSYKFTGELPSAIRRRLNLLAGVLELADREFGLLAREVDQYAKDVRKSAKAGSLNKEELTSLSLVEFLKDAKDLPELDRVSRGLTGIDEVVGELKRFGVSDIEGVRALLTAEFLGALQKHAPSTSLVGLLRRAMMFRDIERYFVDAWKARWQGMSPETFSLLEARYGAQPVEATLKRFSVRRREEVTKATAPKKTVKSSKAS